MLMIGCAKAKFLADKINNLTYENIHFTVESVEGLSFKVKHNANNDQAAKTIIKQYVSTLPELKNLYINIQYVDEKGTIL